jgi:Predicted pPIWI-associating nuclease
MASQDTRCWSRLAQSGVSNCPLVTRTAGWVHCRATRLSSHDGGDGRLRFDAKAISPASALRKEAKDVALQYFRQARPVLQDLALDDQLDTLNARFQSLIELSERNSAKASYKKHTAVIRKLMPKVTSRIELTQGIMETGLNTTKEDERVIQTLEGLVPSAALSYKQAIIDLADDRRISFRGPALELREALRETLDHLAPDDAVTTADGYVQEKGREGPTMKQKVRFILKARGQSKSSSSVPEQTTMTVDEMVGTLTRSVYDRSSVVSHVASERKTVIQIRRYVVAVLHHLLEL